METGNKKHYLIRTITLLITGVVYMIFLAATFLFKINLETDKIMQDIIHVTIIIAAFAYLLFADMIYNTEGNKADARLVLIFASLFTVPILIGRGIGISYISNTGIFKDSIFNFYAKVSISMTIEVISWTTFFPMSMLFLSKLFFRKDKAHRVLAFLCLTAAICCFTAFLSFFSSNAVFFFIGVVGWGIIFLLIIIVYLMKQLKTGKTGVDPAGIRSGK